MRIAYIAAGAARMYCGSCIHDNTLASALGKMGHQVALVPTYTPLRTDEPNVSIHRTFYGGINVYLQQKFRLFRHTPWMLDSLLDRRFVLNLISRLGLATNGRDLGALAVSVLEGQDGYQHKELSKLIGWLKHSFRPEIVQLTNSMFLGLAQRIKQELNVPVICALQGEDLFLNDLAEPYRSRAIQLMRQQVDHVDGFLTSSRYYADFMAEYIGIQPRAIHVLRWGLNLEGHGRSPGPESEDPFVVGYLARICPEKGFHQLVEAFRMLVDQLPDRNLRLSAAGYLSKQDNRYFRKLVKKISDWGLGDRFDYQGEVDRLQKIRFLNSLHVLSVPTVYHEAKGLYVLESLANGVPVVQPRHGSFPELIEGTGGGILVEPDSTEALAQGIRSLIEDSTERIRLGQQGKKAVHQDFSDRLMAEQTLAVYEACRAATDHQK